MQINELARAKINLCLHVTGQRDDGYHLLDSLVTFADIGDEISVVPGEGFSLSINGPFAAGLSSEDNLILKAAKLFKKNCEGAVITLTKNLPVASGIGGGSADAAATLRAMSRMTGAALPQDSGLSLGADVPACLKNTPCRMQGIGDKITPFTDLPKYPAVLVCPNVSMPTSDIFTALKSKYNAPIAELENTESMDQFLCGQRNDLMPPAIERVNEISQCLAALHKQKAFLSRMSGSGATCFGLFKNTQAALQAAKSLAILQPTWWVRACVLGS